LAQGLAYADSIIACSSFLKQRLIEQGVSQDTVSVVEPGVDPVFLLPDDGGARSIRERYGLNREKVILTLARLDERKGHDKVIEAMPLVLEAVPDALYLVVGSEAERGSHSAGAERARLEMLARALGVDQRVIFVGAVPDDEVPSFYSAADVFAMPNREIQRGENRGGLDYEGFGIVFLEANARGLPVIGGRSGGAVDAVADGESGYLVNPLDEQEIAHRLIELLSDPILAKRLGANGRQRAESYFAWGRAAKQVRSLVQGTATASSLPAVHRRVWRMLSTLVQPDYRLMKLVP
jgi:phosphatidylinositol alpha-1,6-mannosyltransferase